MTWLCTFANAKMTETLSENHLSLRGGAVEAEVWSVQPTVHRQPVENQSCVGRWRLGVLQLTQETRVNSKVNTAKRPRSCFRLVT